jgi:ParB family transcriptional regulator, chromosome partitioning protein
MDVMASVNVGEIDFSPYQSRVMSSKDKDNAPETNKELQELLESVRLNGVMQPVILRRVGDRYQLVDGHMRFVAAKRLQMDTIPAIVREYDDQQAQKYSIIGNLQRVNLSTLETARGFLMALNSGCFRNKRELAAALGKTESYVGEVINALELDERVIRDIDEKSTITDIRILRAIRSFDKVNAEGKSEKQWSFYNKIITDGLSRDTVLSIVKGSKEHKKHEDGPKVSFSDKGRATVRFTAADFVPEKKTELEKAIVEAIQKFATKDDAEESQPVAA